MHPKTAEIFLLCQKQIQAVFSLIISQIIEFLDVQLEVLSILLRTVQLIVNCRWVTFSETRTDGWNLISAKHNKMSQKQHFFLFPPPCLIPFVLQHSISLNGLERSSDWAVLLNGPKYNPWLWCVCLHYLLSALPRFHTCWSHHDILLYQTRFSSQEWRNRFRCYLGNRFLLWTSPDHYLQHWSLLYYSWSARKPVNQSTSSTCYVPVRSGGIFHQRSVNTESWHAC